MTTFVVDAAQFYNGIRETRARSDADSFVGTANAFACEAAMGGLVNRYELAGLSTLSIGSGRAFEEFWLHRRGCRLTLNDLDRAAHGIEAFLRTLPQVEPGSPHGLTYHIEDAGELVERLPEESHDVLYVSSFHPDEIRREQIQEAYKRTRSAGDAQKHLTWPKNEKPYIDVLMRACANVRPGGLIIFQHYRGGVHVDANPNYLDAVRAQFARHGVTLLEAYAFRRSPPHLLVIAYRGDTDQALELARGRLAGKPEIRTFHGRYADKVLNTDLVKVYSLADPGIRPETAFLAPERPLSVHRVRAWDYYRGLRGVNESSPESPVGTRNVLLCREPIKNLIARYGIHEKAVLSLGSGEGFEEYWMHAAGCTLTLNDLDVTGDAYVRSLPQFDGPEAESLAYVLCRGLFVRGERRMLRCGLSMDSNPHYLEAVRE